MFNGEPYYLCRKTPSTVQLLLANEDGESCLSQVPLSQVEMASRGVAGGASILSVDTLATYDSYYYDRKN